MVHCMNDASAAAMLSCAPWLHTWIGKVTMRHMPRGVAFKCAGCDCMMPVDACIVPCCGLLAVRTQNLVCCACAWKEGGAHHLRGSVCSLCEHQCCVARCVTTAVPAANSEVDVGERLNRPLAYGGVARCHSTRPASPTMVWTQQPANPAFCNTEGKEGCGILAVPI